MPEHKIGMRLFGSRGSKPLHQSGDLEPYFDSRPRSGNCIRRVFNILISIIRNYYNPQINPKYLIALTVPTPHSNKQRRGLQSSTCSWPDLFVLQTPFYSVPSSVLQFVFVLRTRWSPTRSSALFFLRNQSPTSSKTLKHRILIPCTTTTWATTIMNTFLKMDFKMQLVE